jgi:CRISP-associated protein Cas1
MSKTQINTKQICTLICNEGGSEKIFLENSNLIFNVENRTKLKIPLNKILFVQIVSRVTITSVLIEQLSYNNIPVFFCNNNFVPSASIEPIQNNSHYQLKQKQFQIRQSNNDSKIIAKKLIFQKILNQIKNLQKSKQITNQLATQINQRIQNQLSKADSIESLMGIEGSFSKSYFENLFGDYNWKGRQPRVKADPYNYLLDIGYTYLFNYIQSILYFKGFEVTVGVLHTMHYQRKSLVCDLMEPWRYLIDYELYRAIKLKKFNSDDFEFVEQKTKIKNYKLLAKYLDMFCKVLTDNSDVIYESINNFETLILDYDTDLL